MLSICVLASDKTVLGPIKTEIQYEWAVIYSADSTKFAMGDTTSEWEAKTIKLSLAWTSWSVWKETHRGGIEPDSDI
jgi:hypothetical protein